LLPQVVGLLPHRVAINCAPAANQRLADHAAI